VKSNSAIQSSSSLIDFDFAVEVFVQYVHNELVRTGCARHSGSLDDTPETNALFGNIANSNQERLLPPSKIPERLLARQKAGWSIVTEVVLVQLYTRRTEAC